MILFIFIWVVVIIIILSILFRTLKKILLSLSSNFLKTLLRIVWMILSSDVSVKSRITADSSSKLKWEVHCQICSRFSTSSRICISPSDSFFLEGLKRWDSAERPFVTCVSDIYDVE